MSGLQDRMAGDASLREIPAGLWDRLRADPSRAPEYLALEAAERHGPAAAAWVAEKRSRLAASPHDLALMAKKRHASMARLGGAVTGVGGFITVVPDLAATAWIQSRCVFFIAASYGFDPLDPMRPAELLVLQDLYPDPSAARAALDGTGTKMTEAMVGARMGPSEDALTKRLARMVGKRAVRRVGARLVPGFAIAVNAIGNERDTRALADRAIAFYGGGS